MAFVEWLHRGPLSRETVGGKGASLSELMSAGFSVPMGFSVTTDGFRLFASDDDLAGQVSSILSEADLASPAELASAEGKIAALLESSELPQGLSLEITNAYDELAAMTGLACAVRSSATAEDGASSSFAGLYESYLNVIGTKDVLASVKRCYGSLWSSRALQSLQYRSMRSDAAGEEAMSVVVMGLVKSETSGISFTAHPVTGSREQVVINASFGLGEAIVSGSVTPDLFVVNKETFELQEREIYRKELAIYPHPDGTGTSQLDLPDDRANAPSLSDEQACEVARLAARVESHYGSPQDIEWGMTGGDLFLLQSRPITTLA